jgi:hypothetical protein
MKNDNIRLLFLFLSLGGIIIFLIYEFYDMLPSIIEALNRY